MKVLWFSVTPSLYSSARNEHNGGGWIESLERIVTKRYDMKLGISFIDNNASKGIERIKGDNVTYYPINTKRRGFRHLVADMWSPKRLDEIIISKCLEVIKDFEPDIIQVFGSEWCFGLLKKYVKIPIVIHMQGSWPPYRNAQYPPGYGKLEKYLSLLLKPKKLLSSFLLEHKLKEMALREEQILSINDYYFCRTRWDKAITELYNPNRKYAFCSEALRPSFVRENRIWQEPTEDCFMIVSVGGGHVLKGYDMLLKTALLLKMELQFDFEWILCGPSCNDMRLFEKMTGIRCRDVGVKPMGRCSANDVKETLLSSNLLVHTSYIDNSPNSICEAQCLGLPIISTDVGGIQSLFDKEYPRDMLVPPNDPYYLAAKIHEIAHDKEKLNSMAYQNLVIARDRHNDENIYKSLWNGYLMFIKDYGKNS